MLAEPRRNILVVGDDDQSIYSFRGASVGTIINFDKDFPGTKVIVLDQNYRSTATILNAANSLISKNRERRAKRLWTSSDDGDLIKLFVGEDEAEEAEYIAKNIAQITDSAFKKGEKTPYSSIAIFYRTNAQSRAIEDALVYAGIPYKIFGGLKFYDRKEIKDILAYLRMLINPDDGQSFLRIINTPPRGIGSVTVSNIENLAYKEGISLLKATRLIADQVKSLSKFIELYDDLLNFSFSHPLSDLIGYILERSGYIEKLKSVEGEDTQSRIENLMELKAIGSQMDLSGEDTFDTIRKFLDRASLSSGGDLPNDANSAQDNLGFVSLATLHLAKGLEFPVVFLTGLEEGLIPHYRSKDNPEALEEERRLCYVGITRAMKQLYLTRSENRDMFSSGGSFGSTGSYRVRSRFLSDIPTNLLDSDYEKALPRFNRYEIDDSTQIEPIYNKYKVSSFDTKSKDIIKNLKSFNKITKADYNLKNIVHVADDLPESTSLPPISADKIFSGSRIFHPIFGEGTILNIDGDLRSKYDSTKVTILFDKGSIRKRLQLKYAKLRSLD